MYIFLKFYEGFSQKFKVCAEIESFKIIIEIRIKNQLIQINQPTKCNNFSSLLRDVYVQLNMFRASSLL